MITNSSLPSLAYPPLIHVPAPVKAVASGVHAFIQNEETTRFNDLADLASTSVVTAGRSRNTRPSDHLRAQWDALRTAIQEQFAADLTADPDSPDQALEAKKTHLKGALSTLDRHTGVIGKYFAGYCENFDKNECVEDFPKTVLQAFNRFFGACHSCGDPAQRIDAMLAALTIGQDELECTDGTRERLESIVARTLKPSSNLMVSSRYYSTLDRFAARSGINTGAVGVHLVHALGNNVITNQKKQFLTDVEHDLGHDIQALLQNDLPALLIDLHAAFAKAEPPLPKELDVVRDKHLLAWNAVFPAGTSGSELLQNQTYVVWNDGTTAITDVKWHDLQLDVIVKLTPFLGADVLLPLLDANLWAAPLKTAFEQALDPESETYDPGKVAKLAGSSAASYLYLKQHVPEDRFALIQQYREPDTRHTCLDKLALNRELAPLIRKGEVDPHELLRDPLPGEDTPFSLVLDVRDAAAIEALYLRCLAHENRDKLLRAMQLHMLVDLPRWALGASNSVEGMLHNYVHLTESEESIAYFQGMPDLERACWLATLGRVAGLNHTRLAERQCDQMSLAQIDTLIQILGRLPEGYAESTRLLRCLFQTVPADMLRALSPQQLEETANLARLKQDVFTFDDDNLDGNVDNNFDKWKALLPEGMAAFVRILQVDHATSKSGEAFLRKHREDFFKMGAPGQVETAAMFAYHRAFTIRHAEQWVRLDQTQMHQTRRALDIGLLGKLGTARFDPHWKLANPLINPQQKWFKLSGAQMASLTAHYGKDPRVDAQIVKQFPQLRKLDDRQIRAAIGALRPLGIHP